MLTKGVPAPREKRMAGKPQQADSQPSSSPPHPLPHRMRVMDREHDRGSFNRVEISTFILSQDDGGIQYLLRVRLSYASRGWKVYVSQTRLKELHRKLSARKNRLRTRKHCTSVASTSTCAVWLGDRGDVFRDLVEATFRYSIIDVCTIVLPRAISRAWNQVSCCLHSTPMQGRAVRRTRTIKVTLQCRSMQDR